MTDALDCCTRYIDIEQNPGICGMLPAHLSSASSASAGLSVRTYATSLGSACTATAGSGQQGAGAPATGDPYGTNGNGTAGLGDGGGVPSGENGGKAVWIVGESGAQDLNMVCHAGCQALLNA